MTLDQVNPDLLYLAYWLSPYIDRLINLLELSFVPVMVILLIRSVAKLINKGAR